MDVIHQDLSNGRWYAMPAMQQLGNIGSEIERAFHWEKKENRALSENALIRALELIDFTVADPKWLMRLKELLRLREVLCSYFFGGNIYCLSSADLQKEFLYYGIAARADR